eukprot:m.194141 g.194141  ORF g.194141 m.194141 type:complete len:475 (-) comp16787_c9_seq1:485-1909(-)
MDGSLLRQSHMMPRDALDPSYSSSFLGLSTDKPTLPTYDMELQNLRSKLQIETRQRHQLSERCDQLEAMIISQREDFLRLEHRFRLLQAQLEQQHDYSQHKIMPKLAHVTMIELCLTRTNGSYGLVVRGGRKSPIRWLYVHAITKDGAAAVEGSIRRGDRVLEINGISTEDMTTTDAEEELNRGDSVRLKLSREPGFILSLRHQGVNLDNDKLDVYSSPSTSPALATDLDVLMHAKRRGLATLNINKMQSHGREATKQGSRLHQKNQQGPSSPKRVTFATSARSKVFEQEDSQLPDDSFCVPLQPADVPPPSPGIRVTQLDELSTSVTSQTSETEDHDESQDDVGTLDPAVQALLEECRQSCAGYAVKCVRLEKQLHENTLGISICSRAPSGEGDNTTDIGPYIVSIRAGGPAARSNKIRLEDQLLAVDGTDVRYMDTRDVITYLQETKSVVHLIVARKKGKKQSNGASPQTML